MTVPSHNNEDPTPTSASVGFDVPARLLSEDVADEPLPSINGYIVARLVGRGPHGGVYRVFKEGSHRPLALKLLSQPMEAPAIAQARNRLDALAQVSLDHSAHVVECGQHEGRLFVVSEFVDGLPLDEFCLAAGTVLTLRDRVELLAQLAEAVVELHGRGLAHGAIKAGNMLVTVEGVPVLVDLGTHAQAQARADLEGLAAAALIVLGGDAAPSSLPEPLSNVLRRAAESQDGYSTAGALATDLRQWLGRGAAGARLWERVVSLVRSRPGS